MPGKGTRLVVISFRSTFREPSNRMGAVKFVSYASKGNTRGGGCSKVRELRRGPWGGGGDSARCAAYSPSRREDGEVL